MKRAVAAALTAMALATGAADAAPPVERAREMLAQAKAALSAARTPRETLAALGRGAQAQEAALAAIRDDLRVLAAKQAGLEAQTKAERRRLTAALAALQRLERAPRAALLAHPGGALAAARAGGVLAAFTPMLEAEAARLRAALALAASLSAERGEVTTRLRSSLSELHSTRSEIADLLRRNRKSARVPQDVAARLDTQSRALAAAGESLAALSAALPAGRASADQRFSAAKGVLSPPVEGVLSAAFGDAGDGVEISAPPYAEVYAPWSGVVRFAGPYDGYDHVLILEPEAETLIVIAGLGRVHRAAGETVLAGEALGLVAGPPPPAEEFLIAAASAVEALAVETLYMEVRRGGKPVDPAAWFAFGTIKGDEE